VDKPLHRIAIGLPCSPIEVSGRLVTGLPHPGVGLGKTVESNPEELGASWIIGCEEHFNCLLVILVSDFSKRSIVLLTKLKVNK
jgi:hypothetical protein